MWFRVFVASWSVAFAALLGWLATHKSSEGAVLGRYSPAYFALLLGLAAAVTVSLLAQRSFLYRRLYAVRREIILVLSSTLISLIMVEVAIRVLDPFGISYFEYATRYHLDKVPDPVLVFKHAPGLQKTYGGFRVVTNDLGLRDRNLEKKQDGELRILLLGDSVTFGSGVPIEATFGRKLESMLAAKLGRPVRTVNTGVGGYNTVQEYGVLRTFSNVVDPDVVLLLYVRNDIQSNDPPFDPWSEVSLQGKSPSRVIAILLGKSWLYRLGVFALDYSRSQRPASLDRNARGVKESMDALSGIASFCRERGATFVTFFYRSKEQQSRGSSAALLSEVESIGRTSSFPVADVGSWWGEVDMRSVTNSIVDSHPNDRGHELLARGMTDFLMTHGLVSNGAVSSTGALLPGRSVAN